MGNKMSKDKPVSAKSAQAEKWEEELLDFIVKVTEPTESGKPEVDGYRYTTVANAIVHWVKEHKQRWQAEAVKEFKDWAPAGLKETKHKWQTEALFTDEERELLRWLVGDLLTEYEIANKLLKRKRKPTKLLKSIIKKLKEEDNGSN